MPLGAGPVGHGAAGSAARHRMAPHLLAGVALHAPPRRCRSAGRGCCRSRPGPRRSPRRRRPRTHPERPGRRQLGDVAGVDLVEGEKRSAADIAGEAVGPVSRLDGAWPSWAQAAVEVRAAAPAAEAVEYRITLLPRCPRSAERLVLGAGLGGRAFVEVLFWAFRYSWNGFRSGTTCARWCRGR